jgi:hypothetical protein
MYLFRYEWPDRTRIIEIKKRETRLYKSNHEFRIGGLTRIRQYVICFLSSLSLIVVSDRCDTIFLPAPP